MQTCQVQYMNAGSWTTLSIDSIAQGDVWRCWEYNRRGKTNEEGEGGMVQRGIIRMCILEGRMGDGEKLLWSEQKKSQL